MVLAQTLPAASCYSLLLKITKILGETSYIIHGFDLLIFPLSRRMTFFLAVFQSALSSAFRIFITLSILCGGRHVCIHSCAICLFIIISVAGMSKSIASYNPLDRPLIPYFRPLAGMSESSRQQMHVTDDTNIEPE